MDTAHSKPPNAIQSCTECGHRYLPMSNRAGSVCDRCLAREFEEDLAHEILRATSLMPPRHRPAADSPHA